MDDIFVWKIVSLPMAEALFFSSRIIENSFKEKTTSGLRQIDGFSLGSFDVFEYPVSADSIPPVAKIRYPGRAFAMAETPRRAIGRIAEPDIPP